MIGIIEGVGGGAGSDDVTATRNLILKGYTAITKESDDEPIEGTLDIQPIQSFSAEGNGVRRVVFRWKNPPIGAYSGIIVVYRTDRNPTSITDGTRIYKGNGNIQTPNEMSSHQVTMPAENTNYYFLAAAYAVKNGEEWISPVTKTASVKTSVSRYVYTSSGSFTVPTGVTMIDVFCVGGGGGGGGGYSVVLDGYNTFRSGGGGGGGYVNQKKDITVTPGQKIPVTIGAGGAGVEPVLGNYGNSGGNGGTTSFGSYCSASGGGGGISKSPNQVITIQYPYQNGFAGFGGKGGSGGGGGNTVGAGTIDSLALQSPGAGGSNGGNGGTGWGRYLIESGSKMVTHHGGMANAGAGSGKTTREFGHSSLTLYSGAGGGGGISSPSSGAGGAGGGGKGSYGSSWSTSWAADPGTNGYGGGGGAGTVASWQTYASARGGSGTVVIVCK